MSMDTSILSEKAQARLNEIRQQVRANMKATTPKRTVSLETRQKLSLAAKTAAENMSPEARQRRNEKRSLAAKNRSPETRKKLSLAAKRVAENMSPEARQRRNEKRSLAAKKGRTYHCSPETRQKRREMMSQPFTCTHCGKSGKGYVMYRHHFDNCKQKCIAAIDA